MLGDRGVVWCVCSGGSSGVGGVGDSLVCVNCFVVSTCLYTTWFSITRLALRDDLLADFQRERDTTSQMASMSLNQPPPQPYQQQHYQQGPPQYQQGPPQQYQQQYAPPQQYHAPPGAAPYGQYGGPQQPAYAPQYQGGYAQQGYQGQYQQGGPGQAPPPYYQQQQGYGQGAPPPPQQGGAPPATHNPLWGK